MSGAEMLLGSHQGERSRGYSAHPRKTSNTFKILSEASCALESLVDREQCRKMQACSAGIQSQESCVTVLARNQPALVSPGERLGTLLPPSPAFSSTQRIGSRQLHSALSSNKGKFTSAGFIFLPGSVCEDTLLACKKQKHALTPFSCLQSARSASLYTLQD